MGDGSSLFIVRGRRNDRPEERQMYQNGTSASSALAADSTQER